MAKIDCLTQPFPNSIVPPRADTDTDYSESEALSSLPMSGPPKVSALSPPSMSDSEQQQQHQVLRIETKTAPKPSQVEVVLSDGEFKGIVFRYRRHS